VTDDEKQLERAVKKRETKTIRMIREQTLCMSGDTSKGAKNTSVKPGARGGGPATELH